MVNWNPTTASHPELAEIADIAADAIYFELGNRDEQMAFLELAAAELNRRRDLTEYNGWDPRTDSHENLTAVAEVMADGIRNHWGPRDGNMALLELAAAELNRRRALIEADTKAITWSRAAVDVDLAIQLAEDMAARKPMSLEQAEQVYATDSTPARLIPLDADKLVTPF